MVLRFHSHELKLVAINLVAMKLMAIIPEALPGLFCFQLIAAGNRHKEISVKDRHNAKHCHDLQVVDRKECSYRMGL
jgi:hypothetical protein